MSRSYGAGAPRRKGRRRSGRGARCWRDSVVMTSSTRGPTPSRRWNGSHVSSRSPTRSFGCRNGRPAGRARRRPSDRRPLCPTARARGRLGQGPCAAARHSPLESRRRPIWPGIGDRGAPAPPATHRLDLGGLHATRRELLGLRQNDPLVVQVAERGGGNPLLVGELARHLRAGHDVSSVPPSVRDAVRNRLDARTPACARRLTWRRSSAAGSTQGWWRRRWANRRCRRRWRSTRPSTPGWSSRPIGRGVTASCTPWCAMPSPRRIPVRGFRPHTVRSPKRSSGTTGRPTTRCRAGAPLEHCRSGGRPRGRGRWCERAAEAANRSTAWEQAATLYERAAELTDRDADRMSARRLLGAAKARLHCDEITAAVEQSMEAAEAARRLGGPDCPPRPVSSPKAGPGHPSCWDSCTHSARKIAALDPDDHALRARLLGQLAVTAFYVDPAATEPLSREALAEADIADDPLAIVAAVRARQMRLIEPHHAAERLAVGGSDGSHGAVLNRPTVTQWESIWRVNVPLELGRVGEARHELVELRRRVATVGLPISQWHLARVEALLADAGGRFDEAIVWTNVPATSSRCSKTSAGASSTSPSCSRCSVMSDTTPTPCVGSSTSITTRRRRSSVISRRWLRSSARRDRRYRAGTPRYARLASPTSWVTPPFLRFAMTVLRVELAVPLDRHDDLPPLIAVLEQHRGLHAGATGGGVDYPGCAELWLGVAGAALGEHDDASPTSGSGRRGDRAETPPIAVRTAAELPRRSPPVANRAMVRRLPCWRARGDPRRSGSGCSPGSPASM